MRRRQRGFFAVLDGVTCTGKDKQAGILVRRCVEAGVRAQMEVEPTDGPFGQVVRATIEKRKDAPFYEALSVAETLFSSLPDTRGRIVSILKRLQSGESASVLEAQILFMADRFWHCIGKIGPTLDGGGVIICSRYELSTFAFGSSHGVELAELIAWQDRILGGRYIEPDLTIHIRLSPESAASRLAKDGKVKDMFETEAGIRKTVSAYDRVIDFGREHRLFGKIVEIDGEPQTEKVTAAILAELKKNSDIFKKVKL